MAIQFCVQIGMTPTDRQIQWCFEEPCFFKWHSRYSDDWTDSAQRGQKPYVKVGNVKATMDVIDGDRRKTVREVSEYTGISKSSVQ